MSEHRECIEVETDYDRGVMDERKQWEAKRCETCIFIKTGYCIKLQRAIYKIQSGAYVARAMSCIYHEPKGSE